LPIADCRLSIENIAWQPLPLSIGNLQSKIGNSRAESIEIFIYRPTLDFDAKPNKT
jgi:hypothetical protein